MRERKVDIKFVRGPKTLPELCLAWCSLFCKRGDFVMLLLVTGQRQQRKHTICMKTSGSGRGS